MKIFYLLPFLAFFISCKQENKALSAQQIIDKTIVNAGGDTYEKADISFTFRGTKYRSKRNGGQYELSRSFQDSVGKIEDVLTNTSFKRFVNDSVIVVADSTASKYSNSVNSVHYFVQLPYGLNATAVTKKLVGEAEIEEKKYYEIEVTFSEEGGGTDHEDIYMYWIAQDDFTADYFAYKFYTGKGGIRFRKAYNPRTVNGIRFVDYKNYKVNSWENVAIDSVDELYNTGKLELLSEIKTEDISVVVSDN